MNLEEKVLGDKFFDINSVLNAGKIGMWKLEQDLENYCLTGNNIFSSLLGNENDNVIISLDEFLNNVYEDDKDRVREELLYIIKMGGTYNSEYRIYNKKENSWRYVYAFGVTNTENNKNFIVGGMQDLEDKLILNNNNTLKQSLKCMSHEIRTPINNIIGIIQLLNKTDVTEKQKIYLEKTNHSANLLLHIANNVLDFSKTEAGKMQIEQKEFSIKELIIEVSNVVHYQLVDKDLKLIINYTNKLQDIVIGDPLTLKQILLNLLTNAIKFTKKGTITLAVTQQKEDNSIYLFSVKDTGIGINSEEIKILFEPYNQVKNENISKYNGIGLGLAISKNLVNLMGGKIWCESIFGSGSEFYFTTKLFNSSQNKLHYKNSKKLKVLLIDDDEINRMILKEILIMEDMVVDVAVNGLEALELLNTSSMYDLFIMDIQMPELNGIETTKKIRKHILYEKTPIIMMSASVSSIDIKTSLSAGANSYINKPVVANELYDNIKRLIFVNKAMGIK